MFVRWLRAPAIVTLMFSSLVAGCASATQAAATTAAGAASPSRTLASVTPAAGGVFGRVLVNPAVTVTADGLFVAWQVNPATASVPQFELARVDQATGAIEASYRFSPGYIGSPLTAGHWLWVTTSPNGKGESLLRLNPADLAVSGDLPVVGASYTGAGAGNRLAIAGGALWVTGGDRLLRVSLTSGQLLAAITLPDAFASDVAANSDGTVLIVGEAANTGLGSVQRRNPVTGALLASHSTAGVTAPELGGVIDSGVWASVPTGMLGYVERFAVATMTPDAATDVGGTNGIAATVADTVVWITDGTGGSGRNYCADPVTGRRLATIPLPNLNQDHLLAVSPRSLYYDAPASNGFYVRTVNVPAACMGLSRVIFTSALFTDPTIRRELVENVVLVDETGCARGTAAKAAVHHAKTPLHLAFSAYLFNRTGQFLLTRRAESKPTWPGVWTNTCCGHPLPGEPVADSVRRRLRQELGIGAAELVLVLPRFRYHARMANGVLENEVCPVYAAYSDATPTPDPAEVAEIRWVDWYQFCDAVGTGRQPVSPWCAMQVPELMALGPEPLAWASADAADLPPAAVPSVLSTSSSGRFRVDTHHRPHHLHSFIHTRGVSDSRAPSIFVKGPSAGPVRSAGPLGPARGPAVRARRRARLRARGCRLSSRPSACR
jgi:isopentenyl-diphosphate Delta-isomerase